MRRIKINQILYISTFFVLLFLWNCLNIQSFRKKQVQNLRAFTKLYGYVKYFHPSDEASQIDWDAFAIYGVKKVKNVKNSKQLKTKLEELFLPIAPTIQIYLSNEKPKDPMEFLPKDTTGLKTIAWQHFGVGFGSANSLYKSVRLNRNNKFAFSSGFGTVTQGIDATMYRGKTLKMKASVRANVRGFGNQAQLWLRVDRENRKMGFFDNMSDRPIKSNEWKEYEIEGKVDKDAQQIVFGCLLAGKGQVWVDDFEISVKDEKTNWESVDVKNSGFEEGEVNKKPKLWIAQSPGHIYKLSKKNPYKGKMCLLLENKFINLTQKLFDKHPEVGEVIKKKLNSDLFCLVPLALYSDEKGTLGKYDKLSLQTLESELTGIALEEMTANNKHVRLANIVMSWNVFQHFYPYFDEVDVNWDEELTDTLKETLNNKTENDFYFTLSKMIAKLQDGHGGAYHRIQAQQAGPPFKVDWIENQVVITVSKNTPNFQRGDIILSIDGKKAGQALRDAEEYISGSPQWKRYKSLMRFGYGDEETVAQLKIKRGNEVLDKESQRTRKEAILEPKRPNIEELENNIFYVNLDKATMKEISRKINELAEARGVIFDLRGYPQGNHQVICHLLRKKDTSRAWMKIPLIIYPDQENLAAYQEMGWGLSPMKPHIKGKAVFLIDARIISYAESFMSFIEHYKLGEIVGQPTAGTNGNINPFVLPGGFRILWTGMKVVKHDGSQHHTIGIQPTVSVNRTIKGVIEGRDEFLDKALEIINQ